MRVLVTRPAGQADRLCELIEANGWDVERLPAIEITEPQDTAALEAMVSRLDEFDLAVFVSANAVHKGLDYFLSKRDWPANLEIAAVGPTSGAAVEQHGLSVSHVPVHEFSSEGLLALDALQAMADRKVVIFRGNGGRSKLYDALTARGAQVEYAEVYSRRCPAVDPESVKGLLSPGHIDVITAASNETLENLFTMVGEEGRRRLKEKLLVVPGQRQVACAERLGFRKTPVVADNASDEAIVAALKSL